MRNVPCKEDRKLSVGRVGRRKIAAFHVGGTGKDQPVYGLQPPTAANEFAGEKVQQLGVCGFFARYTKITRRAYNPSPEMMVPQPIHDYAGKQMAGASLGISEPFCEGRPVPGRPGSFWRRCEPRLLIASAEHLQEARCGLFLF